MENRGVKITVNLKYQWCLDEIENIKTHTLITNLQKSNLATLAPITKNGCLEFSQLKNMHL